MITWCYQGSKETKGLKRPLFFERQGSSIFRTTRVQTDKNFGFGRQGSTQNFLYFCPCMLRSPLHIAQHGGQHVKRGLGGVIVLPPCADPITQISRHVCMLVTHPVQGRLDRCGRHICAIGGEQHRYDLVLVSRQTLPKRSGCHHKIPRQQEGFG